MDAKLFARIGAGAFVAVALTMSVLQLREGCPAPQREIVTVFEPKGDPLSVQLRACAAMGEMALSAPDCRAAWAENRRRFLGIEGKAGDRAVDPSTAPPQPYKSQPEGE